MNFITNLFRRLLIEDETKELDVVKAEETETVDKVSDLNQSMVAIVNNQFEIWGLDNTKDLYKNNYVIYRGINLLAQNIASLPLDIYKGSNKVETNIPNFNIFKPNASQSFYELIHQACIYYYYRGELMIYINTEGSRISLEVLNPMDMSYHANKNIWRWRNKHTIYPEELIYVRLFNPDGHRGLSPVDVVKEEVINDLKAAAYNKKFFENYGKVGGVLYDEKGNINQNEMQDVVNAFNAVHQGENRAHKILGLPFGLKYDEGSQTMREMQFLESRKDIRDKILGVLGIHKSLLGVTDQVDRANAREARKGLWQDTLRPGVLFIQHEFNRQLFNQYFPGYSCSFDLNAVEELKSDKTERLTQAKGLQGLGYTLNEINESLDLAMPEVSDQLGDMRFISSTQVPVEEMLLSDADYGKSSTLDSNVDKIYDLLEQKDTESNNVVLDKASRNYVNKVEKLRRTIERKMTGKLRGLFSKQLSLVMAQIKNTKSLDKADSINEADLLNRIRNIIEQNKDNVGEKLKPLYTEASEGSTALAIKAISSDKKPYVNTEIVEDMVNKIKNINNHTYFLIRRQVKEAIAEGETIDQISKRVIKVYKFNTSRARIISRTESGKILNRSAAAEYESAGVKSKQWLGGHRKSHVDNNSKGVVDWDYVYNGGLKFPGDSGPASEVISCTCAIAPVIELD